MNFPGALLGSVIKSISASNMVAHRFALGIDGKEFRVLLGVLGI